MSYKNSLRSISIPLIIAISVLVGVGIGNRFSSGSKSITTSMESYKSYGKIENIVRMIDENYVDSLDINKIVEDAIPSLLKTLDPHTVYIPASEFEEVNEGLSGQFGGVGIQFVMHKDTVAVVKVMDKSPSKKVGIIDGDRIVKVNDTLIAGVKMDNDRIMRMMRGSIGSKVRLTVKRKNQDKLIPKVLERDAIPLKSIDVSYMIDETIGYIKVNKFAMETYTDFVKGILSLKKEGMKKLIVDLRGNTGGFLGNAINMINEFLPNQKIIVYTEGKSTPRTDYLSNGKGKFQSLPIAVLIDEDSASASEIFAGAIQDNDRGFILGRRSFGKGLVQEQRMLDDGSALRLTVSRYHSPSGRCIQKSYENGKEKYYSDIYERYTRGEFSVRDSVHFNDSLKFKTTKGRIVYGGGGIMPDVFIPLDTMGYSKYLGILSNSQVLYKFSFQYADVNREKLSTFKDYKSILKYLESQNIIPALVSYAEKEGIKRDPKGLKISKDILLVRLYAYIARNIIDDEGFYPIIASIDDCVEKAYTVLKENKELK